MSSAVPTASACPIHLCDLGTAKAKAKSAKNVPNFSNTHHQPITEISKRSARVAIAHSQLHPQAALISAGLARQ
jgi:hypothetical protein